MSTPAARRAVAWVLVAVGLASLALAASGWVMDRAPAPRLVEATAGELVPIVQVTVQRRLVDADRVDAPVEGTVTRIAVVEGDMVGVGQELVRIDGRPVIALAGHAPLRRTLADGVRGEDVGALQASLRNAGYDTGPIDGVFGPITQKAVRRFQAERGLADDGEIGPAEIVMLPLPLEVARVRASVGDAVRTDLGIDLVAEEDSAHSAWVVEDRLAWMGLDETITAAVAGAPLPAVVKIPREAVRTRDGTAFVTVASPEGALSERRVALGARSESEVQVTSGLRAGTRVVAGTEPATANAIPGGWLLAVGLGALASAGALGLRERRSARAAAAEEPADDAEERIPAWGPLLDRVSEMPGDTSELETDLYALYQDAKKLRGRYASLRRGAAEVYGYADTLEADESLRAVRRRLLQAMEKDGVRLWEPAVGQEAPPGCRIVPAGSDGRPAGTVVEVVTPGLRAEDGEVVVAPLVRAVTEREEEV